MPANTVVLVHGWGGSFDETWRKPGVVDILSDVGLDVVGVDLLGHGSAEKPHDPAAYEKLPDHLLAQFPDEPAIVIAFSLGAITSLRVAIDHPSRFAGLVIAGVGDGLFEPHKPEETARIISGVEGTTDADDSVAQLFGRYARQGGNDPVALTAVLKRAPAERLTPELLSRVTCPVLVCIGDKDFAAPADRLTGAFPSGELEVLARTDHFATPNSFGFIDAVVGWLENRFVK